MSIEHLFNHESTFELSAEVQRQLGHAATEASRAAYGAGYDQAVSPLEKQIISERSYDNSIVMSPFEYDTALSDKDVIDRMEVDHVVKHAPRLTDQLNDPTRNNIIYSVHNPDGSTESAALGDLHDYLQSVPQFSNKPEINELAKDIDQNITFIGEKEYTEAVNGISTYWKHLLTSNPDQQIFIPTGRIARAQDQGYGLTPATKSDDYLLDRMLATFTDDELAAYKGKLITEEADINVDRAENLKVVFLDDWTISGDQLSGAAESFMDDYPNFASSVEIQLITANSKKIASGLVGIDFGKDAYSKRPSLPVRAYFLAHDSAVAGTASGSRITGAHSSVDFDFEQDLSRIRHSIKQTAPADKVPHIPYLHGIKRPYRTHGNKLVNRARITSARNNP